LYANPETWIDSVHDDDRGQVEEAFRSRLAEGTYRETYRILRPDGTVRWIRDRAFPLRDTAGTVYRVVGIAEDITEQQLLEDKLRKSQKMEAIGTLAGGIAHDFNNILTAILGFSEIITLDEDASNEVRECGRDILTAARRAATLVRQILAFSRQEKQNRRPMQLRSVVQEALPLLRATLPASIEFRVVLEPDSSRILGDPSQIHQIVMNMCSNAGYAMRGKVGVLQVEVHNVHVDGVLSAAVPQLRPGDYVSLSIADTGIGIPPEAIEHIFEPFFTTKGPGLSVVHGIVESHEGAVRVTSTVAVGTRFEIFFPVFQGAEEEEVIRPDVLPKGHGEKILYVDDEESIRAMVQRLLTILGYQPHTESSGSAALVRVAATPSEFDLIITDYNMPNMTGIELATQLSTLAPHVPVVLTTGYSAELTTDVLAGANVVELLSKPMHAAALSACVRRRLSTTRSQAG
jgi:signal transduction histidine kinase/CheY-like chemotaxis protein